MIIYCNYYLNQSTFQIVFHKLTSLWGFEWNRTGHWFHAGLQSCLSGILGHDKW